MSDKIDFGVTCSHLVGCKCAVCGVADLRVQLKDAKHIIKREARFKEELKKERDELLESNRKLEEGVKARFVGMADLEKENAELKAFIKLNWPVKKEQD